MPPISPCPRRSWRPSTASLPRRACAKTARVRRSRRSSVSSPTSSPIRSTSPAPMAAGLGPSPTSCCATTRGTANISPPPRSCCCAARASRRATRWDSRRRNTARWRRHSSSATGMRTPGRAHWWTDAGPRSIRRRRAGHSKRRRRHAASSAPSSTVSPSNSIACCNGGSAARRAKSRARSRSPSALSSRRSR